MEEIGVDGSRVRMVNLSSAMAPEFAKAAREMTERVAALGRLDGRSARCEGAPSPR